MCSSIVNVLSSMCAALITANVMLCKHGCKQSTMSEYPSMNSACSQMGLTMKSGISKMYIHDTGKCTSASNIGT